MYHTHVQKIKHGGTRYYQLVFKPLFLIESIQIYIFGRESSVLCGGGLFHLERHKDDSGTTHHTYHTRYYRGEAAARQQSPNPQTNFSTREYYTLNSNQLTLLVVGASNKVKMYTTGILHHVQVFHTVRCIHVIAHVGCL